MNYNNNSSTASANKTQFVRTAQGINISYIGTKPENGMVFDLALSVDPEGNTVKSLNNNQVETVSFRNSFAEGDLYCYVPVSEIGKTKSVQLMADKDGTKFATFTVNNTISIQTAGAKPASL